jgi:hypothetical protein
VVNQSRITNAEPSCDGIHLRWCARTWSQSTYREGTRDSALRHQQKTRKTIREEFIGIEVARFCRLVKEFIDTRPVIENMVAELVTTVEGLATDRTMRGDKDSWLWSFMADISRENSRENGNCVKLVG